MGSNGSTPTLDTRIADALNGDATSLAELRTLLKEAKETFAAAKLSAAAETKNTNDPRNPHPARSERALQRAQRTVTRLSLAIPPLEAKVKQIEYAEFRVARHEKANDLEKKRNSLAAELAGIYPNFLATITELYADIDCLAEQISQLHACAPIGEHRRLIDAELKARGLQCYTAAQPRLRDNLRLPNWDVSRTIAFPPNLDWSAQAALAGEAMAQRMKEKYGMTYSADWAAARDLALQQEHTEHTKREEALKAQQAADKARYEQKLREAK